MQAMSGRIVVVTGATRGIGRAIAIAFGKSGDTVVGTATSGDGASEITSYLAENGLNGRGELLNVTDAPACEAFVTKIERELGAVAILVNNAGITRDNLSMRMKDQEWDDVIETNLKAVFRMSRLVMRGMMKARFGRIISITSVVGEAGNPGQANYAAAKAGVAGMSRALAQELGSRNITVNCVAPGFIDTDMTRGLPDQQREVLLSKIPLGRLGTPDEIAATVVFLASNGAGYITGNTINVNGGMYMA